MTDQPTSTNAARSRRSLLAAAATASAAAVAASLPLAASVKAANGDAVLVGGSYTGSTATTFTISGANAVVGHSTGHTGVLGVSDTSDGVTGTSTSGAGVYGSSGSWNGVHGTSDGANGVYGNSTTDVGVYGETGAANQYGVFGFSGSTSVGTCGLSTSGTGVLGFTGQFVDKPSALAHTGVYGYSADTAASIGVRGGTTAGVGVLAEASTGTALKVNGKAQFSRSGRKPITAGHSSLKVPVPGATSTSYVIATLQTNRAGLSIQAAVPSSGSVTIYLNKVVTATTYVGYLVIN